MEIRQGLRRSCGQARDNAIKSEAHAAFAAGCAGYSKIFCHTKFMEKNNLG
jgi:hypothetical protein